MNLVNNTENSTAISLLEFRELLSSEARMRIGDLVVYCRARFLRAADLVGLRGQTLDMVREINIFEKRDISLLTGAWDHLCKMYISEYFDPQMTLFVDHKIYEIQKWHEFVYWDLFPELIRRNELVRNVLRAVGGLPCRSKENAASAVYQYISELTFPLDRPAYDFGEEIDNGF